MFPHRHDEQILKRFVGGNKKKRKNGTVESKRLANRECVDGLLKDDCLVHMCLPTQRPRAHSKRNE
ncbi:hypothetical protein ACTXT7_015280, partial [Hymenolepis weldensis]